MYYPYIRGRQFELLALKELVMKDRLSEYIIPIIEPVKLSSTLPKTMEEFVNKDRNICVVCNPSIGSFNSDMRNHEKDIHKNYFLDLLRLNQIIKSHIIGKNSVTFLRNWEEQRGMDKTDWYIINSNKDYVSNYSELYSDCTPKMTFIPDESVFRRTIRRNRSIIEDRFKKRERNSDYADNIDEFFSDDHLYYREDGFMGFSDYSIIGEEYLESGFAPYAVAIHIVYFDNAMNLRVHHFVSDSNKDIQNPAGKFYEAVKKLVEWVKDKNIALTPSLQVFIDHYNNQTYPGLGSVKKLSLMHHLELIGQYLDGVS